MTLATVTDEIAEHGPLLAPYPDHTWFLNATDCSKMTSVRSVTVSNAQIISNCINLIYSIYLLISWSRIP